MNERECRRIVLDRSGMACERCCRNGYLTLHHRKKRSHLPKNRRWDVENCVMLCGDGVRGCHGWVEANPNAAAEEGWHVRPWDDPAEVPVLYRGTELTWLTPDGGFEFEEPRKK